MRLAAFTLSALLLVSPARAEIGTSILEGGGAMFPAPDVSICVDPPTAGFAHVWYIDPVNGHTTSGGGTGAVGAPWKDIQALFTTVSGYTGPLYTGVSGAAGPVAPGDEVLLMNGTSAQYGTLNANNASSSSYLTIAQAPGQVANLFALNVTNSNFLNFVGFSVNGLGTGSKLELIHVLIGGVTHDVQFNGLTAYTTDDATRNGWSQANWPSFARSGVNFQGASNYCLKLLNSEVKNAYNLLSVNTDKTVTIGNRLHHWAQDAVDYAGNDLIFQGNYIHDAFQLSDGSHVDGMQGFVGRPSYHDILIDSNVVLYQTERLNFDTLTAVLNGGIDITDQVWYRLAVVNNVVSFPNHAIALGMCHTCMIAGNTVLPARLFQDGVGHGGEIAIGSKGGYLLGDNTVVKNNISGYIAISDPATVMNNIISPTNPTSGSGRSDWPGVVNAVSPGTYGLNNVIDSVGITGEITAFDYTAFTLDAHLLSSAPARGAGATTMPMPFTDIQGIARSTAHDAGAYAFH